MHFTIKRYGKTRYWQVLERGQLIAVVLYRKGAREVVRRIIEGK